MHWPWSQRNPTKIGRYCIVEKVGQGGTCDVYKAIHPSTKSPVAIKILCKDLIDSTVLRKRFDLEFQITRALHHQNIVRALDYGIENEVPFLVMEYVDGTTLWEHVRTNGKLCLIEALEILTPIGHALQMAHDNGLIHRDVKPDNILIEADGSSKLTDFGLVKDLEIDLNLTDSATALGTPNFMAPEQFRDSKRVDHRCDIYGLAATFYMAVTGVVPFHAKGGLSILKKKLQGELRPPRQFNPDLPPAFEWNILRALRNLPEERPATCSEFLASLTGAPVAAEFGKSEAVEPNTQKERRDNPRYPCDLDGACTPFGQSHGSSWDGRILDVSVGGLGIVLKRRFEPNSVLRVVMPFAEPLGPQPMYVRVRNVAAHDRGTWRVGCEFTKPLGEDDLELLVGEFSRLSQSGVKVSERKKRQ